jgi:endonuclease/exonuclease/phosphatase family metal-dependent hydrolase
MRLLSWNVQWCRGIDARVDPKRIAAEVKRLADPDVVCLQEIARNFPEMAGSAGEDQVEVLLKELPGYQAFFAAGVDLPGKNARRQFGNLVLSRLPVGRVLRHQLPWPSLSDARSMPRAVVEAVIEASFGPLRIMTTHLEYYSKGHRHAQIARLLDLNREAGGTHLAVDEPGSYESHTRGTSALVCGDFNLPPDDAQYRQMVDGEFIDAWAELSPGKPRQATFHLYDGETPYCCDYIFVTADLLPRLKSIRIDTETQASDHQPVILDLA